MAADPSPQFDALADIDWDVLLVLDACRWDVWRDTYGHGRPVTSPASCTLDWLPHAIDHLDDGNTVCVTANPTHAKHYDSAFADHRHEVWVDRWQQYNGIPTVSPRDTTEAALDAWDGDRRLYVHYIQPHGPYPWSDPPIPLTRANPEAHVGHVDMPDDYDDELVTAPSRAFDTFDWLTPNLLREAYDRNLAWVYDALLPFKRRAGDHTVVVTSDHGEWLCDGDGREYGHPCRTRDPILQSVPLWVM